MVVGAVSVLIAIGLAVGSALGANLWRMLTDSDYRVPEQASLWSFKPTVMNPGSGGWWLYGEDGHHYFHYGGDGAHPYRIITRQAARACKGFDARQVQTWCR